MYFIDAFDVETALKYAKLAILEPIELQIVFAPSGHGGGRL